MKTFLKYCQLTTLVLTTVSATLISTISLSAPPQVKEQDSYKTLILTLQYAHDNYEVLNAQVINEKLPARHVNATDNELLNFHLKNLQGDILGQGKIANPHVLRGVLEEHGSDQAHGQQTLQHSTFVVRFPYVQGMQVLGLLEPSKASTLRGRSSTLPAPITRNLLFSNML